MAGGRGVGELEERVGVLAAQVHAASAALVDALAELDAAGGWEGVGFRSFSHWLSVRAGFVPSEAQRLTRLARRVERVPSLMSEARRGAVSAGMCDVAARVSTSENEAAVAEVVRMCTPSQATRVLSQYRRLDPQATRPAGGSDRAEEAAAEEEAVRREEHWSAWYDDDGMYTGSFRLSPARGELIELAMSAAHAALDPPPPDEPGSTTDSSAPRGPRSTGPEALVEWARAYLDHAEGCERSSRPADRYAVQVVIDVETLARLAGVALDPMVPTPVRIGQRAHVVGGPTLTDAEVAEAICDGSIQVLIEDRGVPLWLGNEVRDATPQQRRALRVRSGGRCEFPGCRRRRRLHAHHVWFHTLGGPTSLDNLVLLCADHHHRLHEGAWNVRALGDQRFEFVDRWGHPLERTLLPPDTGPPPRLPGIDPDTPRPIARGEPLTEFGLDVFLHHLLSIPKNAPIAA